MSRKKLRTLSNNKNMKKLLHRLFFICAIGYVIYSNSNAQTASATWPLSSNTTITGDALGNVVCQDEFFSNLTINNYAGPNGSQRVTTLNGSWPAETNQNNTRYIQFAVSPLAGYTFNINSIMLLLGASGGDNMKANIWYSTDPTFANPTRLNTNVLSVTRDALMQLSYTPNITVTDGGTLYLRIYPWYTSASTGKYICPQNVIISGSATLIGTPAMAVSPTSLSFGNVNVNSSREREYILSGSLLTPASGNITVTAPEGFEVSTVSGSNFSSSIAVPYSGGILNSTTIYVKFTPTSISSYEGNITNAGGGAATQSISVTGTGVPVDLIPGIFVSLTGDDANVGNFDQPFRTIAKAISVAQAGDIIYVRGGEYFLSATINISKNGTNGSKHYLYAYENERPLLDFSAGTSKGISLSGSYWHIKGFDIRKAKDNGMYISGSNNIVEFCSFYENGDTGLQLGGGASNNRIINCDSYFNYDAPLGGNADGFAPKLDVGTGNYFYGCRAWQNSDDGWDGYLRPADNVTTTIENSWCFMNGYLKDGSPITSGNGNGFKMGGGYLSNKDSLRHNMILKNCLAFDNRVKGYDQNNNRGSMTLYNNTAYRNGTNYGMPAWVRTGEAMTLINCVALGITGSIWTNAIRQTNSWMPPFATVTLADFVSIDTTGVRGPRKPDGSLPDINFMRLAQGSQLIDAGTDVGLPYNGTAPDLGCFEFSGTLNACPKHDVTISEFQLNQNYPNPFNPSTIIRYKLPVTSNVVLKVYDMLGREVATLVNQNQTAGSYEVIFDASKLSSGTYFYKLTADSYTNIKKLLLIK